MELIKTVLAMPGMVTAEPIYSPINNKLLLKEDTKLSQKLIDMIMSAEVMEIKVVDQYTLSIDPNDTIRTETLYNVSKVISTYAPERPEANKTDSMVQIAKNAKIILEKILENETIVEFCAMMKIINNDLMLHAGTTCGMSMLLAGALHLKPGEIYNIGAAALVHDLGELEMPFIIGKRDLPPHQQNLYKEHAMYGYYFGKEAGLNRHIIEMIAAHHENYDGSGFPKGLKGEEIPLGARIISVCDMYDSLIRYDKLPRYQSVEYLYGGGGYFFDSKISTTFLNNISIYPLGSLVRLSTGEAGVVTNVRKNAGARPVVSVYYNKLNRKHAHPRVIDLGVERTIFIEEII